MDHYSKAHESNHARHRDRTLLKSKHCCHLTYILARDSRAETGKSTSATELPRAIPLVQLSHIYRDVSSPLPHLASNFASFRCRLAVFSPPCPIFLYLYLGIHSQALRDRKQHELLLLLHLTIRTLSPQNHDEHIRRHCLRSPDIT